MRLRISYWIMPAENGNPSVNSLWSYARNKFQSVLVKVWVMPVCVTCAYRDVDCKLYMWVERIENSIYERFTLRRFLLVYIENNLFYPSAATKCVVTNHCHVIRELNGCQSCTIFKSMSFYCRHVVRYFYRVQPCTSPEGKWFNLPYAFRNYWRLASKDKFLPVFTQTAIIHRTITHVVIIYINSLKPCASSKGIVFNYRHAIWNIYGL